MSGLVRKALNIGLGGFAAALLIAGGQANAATCPADDPLSVLTAPGFTCTMGDKVFSDFSFSTNLATLAQFTVNPITGDVVVTFSRDGGTGYLTGTNTFDYTVSVAPGSSKTIVEDTLGVDVSTGIPVVKTTDLVTGNNSGAHTLMAMNGATVVLPISPADTSEMVVLTANQPSGAQLNSISTDIADRLETATVPEPASLSLFALGLLGLGFTRRRHS